MSEENKTQQNPAVMDRLYKSRIIFISGEISSESYNSFAASLFAMDSESNEPIRIFINSPGGEVYSGHAFFDAIRFVKSPVYIIGNGLIASAGALIYLSVPKERRLSLPNARYMIHQPLLQMSENSPYRTEIEVEIEAKEIETLRRTLNTIIAESTGKTLSEIEAATERDHWLSAEEAKEMGLVGKIITSASEL